MMKAGTTGAPPRYQIKHFPDLLTGLPRWCVFQIIHGPNRKTKKSPLIAGVRPLPGVPTSAKSNDPTTLRPFDIAFADAEARGLYLAFAFDRDLPYFFIDMDDVILPDRTIRSDAVLVRDSLDTYTEYSALGQGLHIIGKGTLPARCARPMVPPGCKPFELYPLRGPRFCIFTGNALPRFHTIEERTDILPRLFPPRPGHDNRSATNTDDQGAAGELTDAEIDAIVAWARKYWDDGRRHHMALYVSGELARKRVPRTQAATIIEKCAVDDSDPGAKLTACHDTYDDAMDGADISGWYGLKDVCGVSEEELAPLGAILDAFWQRTRPRTVHLVRRSRGRRPIIDLPALEACHAR